MKSLLTLVFSFGLLGLISAQPIITVQPSDQEVCIDTCASFSITAVGTGMNYFWELNNGSGFVGVGSNSENLVLCDSIGNYDSAYVRCIITDINGDSAISQNVMITVDSCLPPVADFDFYFDFTEAIACYTSTSQRAETLIWLFGDGNTAIGVEDTCHDYADKEMYFVKLYAFNDHGSDTIIKKVDILDIDDPQSTFSIFPNPVQDILMIESSDYIESITLFNLLGAVQNQFTIRSSKAQLDLTGLEPGTYFIRIETAEEVRDQKLVKQ